MFKRFEHGAVTTVGAPKDPLNSSLFGDVLYRATSKDPLRMGRVQTMDQEFSTYYADGKLIVSDAITPDAHTVKFDDVLLLSPQATSWEYDVPGTWIDVVAKAAFDRDNALKAFGVGALFSCPCGDGSAHYVVTKLAGKTKCDVEWRGYSPDEWVDHVFGHGGRFDRKMIERLCGPYPRTHIFGHDNHRKLSWSDLVNRGFVPAEADPYKIAEQI